jgi:hypothetical protein
MRDRHDEFDTNKKGRITMNRRLRLFTLTAGLALAMIGSIPRTAQAAAWFNCSPNSLFEVGPNHGTNSNQIQVFCNNTYANTAQWLAILQSGTGSKTDAQQARFISLFTSALLAGKTFRVYMTDTQCPGFGAGACYLVDSWSIYQP